MTKPNNLLITSSMENYLPAAIRIDALIGRRYECLHQAIFIVREPIFEFPEGRPIRRPAGISKALLFSRNSLFIAGQGLPKGDWILDMTILWIENPHLLWPKKASPTNG